MTAASRRDRPLRSVGESLDRLAGELGLDGARPAVAVHDAWRSAVGDEVADHAEPGRLDEGVLTVTVDDPAWATHLRYLGPRLAADLNAVVGGDVVERLRVVVRRR